MTRFSANLGFLYTEIDLPDAIRAAHRDGFDAVECHWPYEVPAQDIKQALEETGLPMLGINTVRGEEDGQNGLCALEGRQEEAHAAIDQALQYASEIGAHNVHVMAGIADGPIAREVFLGNLSYACARAKELGIIILIEPLNRIDAPGYFLQSTNQARSIIRDVGQRNLKMMFDCYHVGITEGDVEYGLRTMMPLIGHIQIASVPDRHEPDEGELDYRHIFSVLDDLGYTAPIGAEYRPRVASQQRLGWMKALQ